MSDIGGRGPHPTNQTLKTSHLSAQLNACAWEISARYRPEKIPRRLPGAAQKSNTSPDLQAHPPSSSQLKRLGSPFINPPSHTSQISQHSQPNQHPTSLPANQTAKQLGSSKGSQNRWTSSLRARQQWRQPGKALKAY